MKFWKRGQRKEIARYAEIPASNLSEILYRKRTISTQKAMRLELASRVVLKIQFVEREHWIFNEYTNHPAFFGPPKSVPRKLK